LRAPARISDAEALEDPVVAVRKHAQLAAGVLHADDLALADEEAGDADRVLEEAAPVSREVEQQAVRLVLLHLRQQPLHVGGALALGGIGIPVEGRQLDDGELVGLAVDLTRLVAELRGLLGQVDLVAHDGEREALGLLTLAQDREMDPAALLAADQAHGLAQRHVDDADRIAPVLCDGDDLVLGQKAVLEAVRGAARDDALDHGVAVALRERHADALQRERHRDPEVFEHLGREVVGVRVEGHRERVHEAGVEIHLLQLRDPFGAQLVAVDQSPLRLVERLPGAQVVRNLEVHEAAEQFVPLLGGLRIAALVRVDDELDALVDRVVLPADEGAAELLGLLVPLDELGLQAHELGAVALPHAVEDAGHGDPGQRDVPREQQAAGGVVAPQIGVDGPLLHLRGEQALADVVLQVLARELRDVLAAQLRRRRRRGARQGKREQGEDGAQAGFHRRSDIGEVLPIPLPQRRAAAHRQDARGGRAPGASRAPQTPDLPPGTGPSAPGGARGGVAAQ
jgi:hypothetical protein